MKPIKIKIALLLLALTVTSGVAVANEDEVATTSEESPIIIFICKRFPICAPPEDE